MNERQRLSGRDCETIDEDRRKFLKELLPLKFVRELKSGAQALESIIRGLFRGNRGKPRYKSMGEENDRNNNLAADNSKENSNEYSDL